MYLLQGLLIGFGSIFALNAIGAIISREKKNVSHIIKISAIVSLVYGLIVFLIRWGTASMMYGPTPLFAAIIVGAFLSFLLPIIMNEGDDSLQALPGLLVWVVGLIWVIIVAISGADINRSTDKGKLFQVEEKKVNAKIMDLADPAHICLVDEHMARSKAEKALGAIKTEDNANAGSRYKLGDGTKQFVDGQLWWIFPLEFQGYWQWSRFSTVPGYIRASAEDPMAEAQAIQVDKFGKPIIMKYLNSAYFASQAERYLRNNGYLKANIHDFTFEVDDNWRPYYSISQREWTIGYNGSKVTNVLIFDVQTGSMDVCPIAEVSQKYPWIDRANDIDVIEYQANKWGAYSEVGWKFTSRYDGKRKKPTPGWYLTYDNGKCYWFSGWTSYSASSDLIGVSLTDANTGKTVYYPTQGSTEDVAYEIARGHWSNFEGYNPTELVPYNIYGMLTYVIPVAYNGTQFVGVSLVSVINKDINAKGKTLEEALSAYRSIMSSVTSDRGVPYEGQPQKLVITAKVAEVGMSFIQGTNQMYPFTLTGIDKIFQVNYTLQNAKVSFMKPGREVVITYMDTKEKVITCLSFDIPEIKLTDENPAQARWLENQQEVKKEETRINNVQENQFILETEDLSKVNPDSLKKFIESQKK
jgi:hypothetical protein